MGQAERAFSATSTFLSGIMAISASQFLGAPLKLIDPKAYECYMAKTKESFAILMTTITQWWAPTVIRVSGDESMKDQLYQMKDGSLKCNFPHRLVLMANHQLYTDWLYLWWIAYTNNMHGRIYIILKESLKQLPIIGWGMQFYNFIFLSRRWEQDKLHFKVQLDQLSKPDDPMWLLIFPEGTNLSAEMREKSTAWAEKTGIPDMKNQLLPRSTGLQFCLRELRHSTNWVYDCTIAYEGVPVGTYSQDVYTLRSSFIEGRPPKSVNMYWRRYKISSIPIDNDEVFSRWLLNRWREKDYLLEYFNKFGHFPSYEAKQAIAAVEGKYDPKHAKAITTTLKGGGWDEFLGIFGPVTSAAGALSAIDLTEPLKLDEIVQKLAESQQLNLAELQKTTSLTKEQLMKGLISASDKHAPISTLLMKNLLSPRSDIVQANNIATHDVNKPRRPAAKIKISAKATLAPASPHKTASAVARNTIQKQESLPLPSKHATATPAQRIRAKLPMTNTERLITHPLSTVAVQNVATTAQKIAVKRLSTIDATRSRAVNSQSSHIKAAATKVKPSAKNQDAKQLLASPAAGSKAVLTRRLLHSAPSAVTKRESQVVGRKAL
ncbi:acyltransferase-domain-containing protein, partial [Dissoconium aciculare CBS 342.82]|uniref:Acyltransferase-domain-containing protein n=1 Tax=Dissoconium aciculare CBS 342.82 TaxID=1314786 RepID=A0A6J3LQ37_9PEZI